MNQTEISTGDNNSKPAKTGSISFVPKWITETINGGLSPVVDLNTGSNGWASPPGDVFPLRSVDYFKTKQKSPGGDYLLSPAGVDWLISTGKLHNVLAHPDNRVAHALRQAQSRGESLNSFIFAVNFQMPTKEPHSMVLYFATEDPIPSDSLLHQLINGEDDSFRNQRFKLVTNAVKAPRVVKALAGKYGAFLLGKAVNCSYHRGSNYFEIDVDIGSSAILSAALRFTLGYIMSLTADIGFVVEARTEDELPEKLIGAVRICQKELSPSAFIVVDDDHKDLKPCRMMGSAKGNQHDDEEYNKV
ncbi:hypothetical protein AALP_AA1G251900 [Arabis alpina]|uniref:Protein ENHANCED DISEASE RESISTANCE 2 C-terminal domain-containing protein n=1 Tax=Arabis alpina TaxID=50452 RepID=A0A087HQJ3_ARAAL|nr:hypothetical protein AALP_AA1G251900 [Arabis alpina]